MEVEKKRIVVIRVSLLVAFIITAFLSLGIGVKEFSLLGLLQGNQEDLYLAVTSRIPRLLSVVITGAGLSISGLIMQTITNNKFVSPSTAGTMEWCRLGVLLAILFTGGKAPIVKIVFAFVISLAGTLVFMSLLQKVQLKNMFMIPLIGMMLGNVISSITTFLAYKYDVIQNISAWLQGNFSLVIKGSYEILYIGVPCVVIAYLYSSKFTIAGMGKSFATNLGLNHKAVVTVGLVIVAFITSLIVVTIGSIPFIGLIVPNIVSMYGGDNIKNTLFDTALFGAFFVLICDMIGRYLIYPYEINVSVIISVLGSIIFLLILWKKKR